MTRGNDFTANGIEKDEYLTVQYASVYNVRMYTMYNRDFLQERKRTCGYSIVEPFIMTYLTAGPTRREDPRQKADRGIQRSFR